MHQLEDLRRELDRIDDSLLALLADRALVVRAVWEWKAKSGVPRFDGAREQAVRARLLKRAAVLGLDAEAVGAIFEAIVGKQLLKAPPGP